MKSKVIGFFFQLKCGAGRGLTIGQQGPHKTERGAFSFVSLYTLDYLPIKNTHEVFGSYFLLIVTRRGGCYFEKRNH